MAISTTYTYDNASNFTFDSNKLEIDSGEVCLSLEQAVTNISLTLDDDTGSTYTAGEAEFTGGLVQQVNKAPTDSVTVATYTSSINASWNDLGSTAATSIGTPVITSNRLDCSSDDGLRYPISDIIQQGAAKFKYIPDYDGSPSENINVFSLVGSVGGNMLLLTHSPSGDNFRVFLIEGNNNSILSATTIGGSSVGLVSETTYEIELNWDSSAGVVRLFLNGTLHGTLSPGAWSWATQSATVRLGAIGSTPYNASEQFYEDFVVFNVVQHTSGYTAGYSLTETKYLETSVTLPTITQQSVGTIRGAVSFDATQTGSPRYLFQIGSSSDWLYWDGAEWAVSDETYAQSNTEAVVDTNAADLPIDGETQGKIRVVFPASNTNSTVDQIDAEFNLDIGYYTDDPSILTNSAFQTDDLETFVEIADKPANTEIKYTLVISGQDYYHNGTTWTTSDGTYPQANTAAEINTNASTFVDILGNGASVKVNAILHTDDSQVRPCLTSVQVDYSFYTTATAIDTTTVYGYVYNGTTPVSGANLTFRSNRVMLDDNNFIHINKSTTSRSNGYFEVTLPKTSDDANTTVAVKIEFLDEQGWTQVKEFNIDVTATSSSQEIEGLIT
jgi:hypothetical protein